MSLEGEAVVTQGGEQGSLWRVYNQCEEKSVSFFKSKRAVADTAVEIPVLCRLWEEDGIFNGVAEDLAVAVFGDTYEEASKNLGEAIIAHLQALQKLGQLDDVIEQLRVRAREASLMSQSLPRNQAVYRFSAAKHNGRILALV